MSELVTYTITDNVCTLIINRESALNALNIAVLEALKNSLEILSKDNSIFALIIQGAGEKAFVAGADIKEMQSLDKNGIKDFIELGHKVMNHIENFPCCVIAQIKGFALGGGLELALACDFIVATPESKLGLPEVGLGVIPGFGGTVRLYNKAGIKVAKQMILTGDTVNGLEAYRLGFVDYLATAEEIHEEVLKLVSSIKKRGPQAVKEAKKLLNNINATEFKKALSAEQKSFIILSASAEKKEGMAAFLERRPPKF